MVIMNITTIKKLKVWSPVFLWMALIFSFSAQPASQSGELSGSITKNVLSILNLLFGHLGLDPDVLETLIRKSAHFTIYGVLSILVIRAVRRTYQFEKSGLWIALSICFLYACSDEFHQLFVRGRSGQFTDVLIDTFGALVGIGIYIITSKLRKRTSHV